MAGFGWMCWEQACQTTNCGMITLSHILSRTSIVELAPKQRGSSCGPKNPPKTSGDAARVPWRWTWELWATCRAACRAACRATCRVACRACRACRWEAGSPFQSSFFVFENWNYQRSTTIDIGFGSTAFMVKYPKLGFNISIIYIHLYSLIFIYDHLGW